MKHRTPFAVALAATLALSLPFAALADDAGSDSTQADEQASADADAPAAQGDAEAEVTVIQVPRPSEEYAGWTYDDVVSELEAAGFTNIVLVPIGDLNFASQIFTHDGTIESVQIGESTGFTRDATFASDTQATITYHTFQSTIDEQEKRAAYDAAQEKYDAGDYEAAAEEFAALGDWSDSADKALRSSEEARVVELTSQDSEATLAQAPRASGEYEGWSYWDVVNELRAAGFTGTITLDPVGDLVFSLGDSVDKTTTVSIDGVSEFTNEALFAADAAVTITFRTFQSRIDAGLYPATIEIEEAPDESERYYLGQAVNTGLDNGYSGSDQIGIDDVHFGWDLGEFFVGGFTRADTDDDGNPVFLKNVGDTVTLWFTLEQDIGHLNGDANLTVSDDTNGYCTDMGVAKTDLGRGTLLVRYTDYQNNTEETQVYTDYLVAKVAGADTQVQLFEEGDYEVTLLYELKDSPRQVGDLSVAPSYSDYRISFKFSVRNSNCMVYPFDVETGSELADGDVTESGFYLDLARSRYLDIDITRAVVSDGVAGPTEDVRFNRAAADGTEYTDPGIYTFTVSNRYTGETTTKTIYVGDEEDYAAYLGKDDE